MGNDSDSFPGQWAGVTALVVGTWLLFGTFWFPATTGYTLLPQSYWNGVICGTLIILLAAWALASTSPLPNWLHAILGAWLLGSPITLEYGYGHAGFNEVVVGLILTVASVIAGLAKEDLMRRRRGT